MKRKLSLVTCIFLFALISNAYTLSLKEKIDSVAAQIEKKYPLTLYYNNIDSIHGKNLTFKTAPEGEYEKLLRYVIFFNKEINKYPVKFIDRINLKRIAFVKNLASKGQFRYAVPDSISKGIYYDYDVLKYGETYSKHTIHHELYHFIEKEIFGTYHYKDTLWAKLNGGKFIYGKGGEYCYDLNANYNELINPYKGFIDLYGMSGIEEDKAEIFAILFVEPERVLIDEWMIKIKGDKILTKKVKYIKRFLHYLCKEMNNKYWRKL